MEAGLSPARQTRAHRHELRTLTYITLDDANGGVVRNISQEGIGAQVVAALRHGQQLRVRFELRHPRLRVETRGEVVWAAYSGQCGIRFVELPPRMRRQMSEWIFGDLLEGISLHSDPGASMFVTEGFVQTDVRQPPDDGSAPGGCEGDDGLIVSATPVKVIELQAPKTRKPKLASEDDSQITQPATSRLDWLSQPLSGRSLAWAVHSLVVMAGILLFVLVFLSITREAPRWQLAMAGGSAFAVAGLYWLFFRMFGGTTLGARLARLIECEEDGEDARGARFR